jgi:hypothetical protein
MNYKKVNQPAGNGNGLGKNVSLGSDGLWHGEDGRLLADLNNLGCGGRQGRRVRAGGPDIGGSVAGNRFFNFIANFNDFVGNFNDFVANFDNFSCFRLRGTVVDGNLADLGDFRTSVVGGNLADLGDFGASVVGGDGLSDFDELSGLLLLLADFDKLDGLSDWSSSWEDQRTGRSCQG